MPSRSQWDSPSDSTSGATPQDEAAKKRTLLVVDDEEGPRNSVRAVFKNDYNVLMASDGLQAIELAKQNSIDAAVLDIRMAGMSGIDLLEKLKELDSSIEVIMLTAYETIETARKALKLGASDYLDKPFDVQTIRAAVANAMARRSLSDEIRYNNQRLREMQEEMHDQKVREEIALAKGDIYASLIHDLNGPLTIICGLVEMINNKMGALEPNESRNIVHIRDNLAHITKQINKSIDISRRYLSFTRRRQPESCHTSVNTVMLEIGDLMKNHPDAAHCQLHVQTMPKDLLVAINGIDLIQILLNLTSNAFQCTERPHRVDVRSERVPSAMEVFSKSDDAENRYLNREGFDATTPSVAIRVSDDGPGIPPEILARMFNVTFTTKPTNKGTGLGLSIILRFVKEAKGAIHLQSTVGQGTTFTIYLKPCVD